MNRPDERNQPGPSAYPWAIVGIGNGDKHHYEVHNLSTGQKLCAQTHRGPVVCTYDSSEYEMAAADVDQLSNGVTPWPALLVVH